MNCLDRGLYFLLIIFEYYSFYYVILGVRQFRKFNRKTYLALSGIVITMALLIIFAGAIFLYIPAMMYSYLLILLIMDITKKRLLENIFLSFSLNSLLELVLLRIIRMLGFEDKNISYIFCGVITAVIIWLFYLLKVRKLDREIFVVEGKVNIMFSLMFLLFVAMFSLLSALLSHIGTEKNVLTSNLVAVLGGFLLIVADFYLLYIFNERTKVEFEKRLAVQFNNQQKEYFERLLEKENDTRQYRHDMIAQLVQVKYFIDEGEYKEADSFLTGMLKSITSISEYNYDVGNEIVNTMLNYYLPPVKKEGCEIELKGYLPEDLKMESRDLCILVSNVLKNAIEAVMQLKKEERKIRITLDSGKISWKINVVNSTNNTDYMVTTKKDKENHGFGLKNIRSVVEKYKGKCNVELNKGIFSIDIAMKY